MSFVCQVELENGRTGEPVEANLVTLEDKHIADFEEIWEPVLRQYGEEDKGFGWRLKQRLINQRPQHEGYAIECDGLTQGLMVIDIRGRYSEFTRGKRVVLVELLAAAPWNRATIQRPRDYKLVGCSLLLFSRRRSREVGYSGRIGVFALPGAISFYEQMGMTRLKLEPEDMIDASESVPYLEYVVFPSQREVKEDGDLS